MAAVQGPQGIVIGKYTIVEELGRGELSIVCKATKNDDSTAAVKRILLKASKSDTKNQLQNLLTQGNHERVVPIKDFYFHKNEPVLYVVHELCTEGSLNDYMAKKDVDGGEKLAYMEDISKGLHFLHSKGVTHGDLRPTNILLFKASHRQVCKLSDYSLAQVQQLRNKPSEAREIADLYQAPEVIKSKAYSQKSDMYSLALLFYVISSEKYVKRNGRNLMIPALKLGDTVYTIGALVQKGEVEKALLPRFSNLEVLGKAIIEMLRSRPSDRPSIDAVLPQVSEARLAFHTKTGGEAARMVLLKLMQEMMKS